MKGFEVCLKHLRSVVIIGLDWKEGNEHKVRLEGRGK